MGEGRNLVGVDIGSSSIKVCQAKETRKGLVLQRLGYEQVPHKAIVDGQVMDASAVVETLKRACHDAKIRQKDVALSVSGQAVIIRKISVPMMTEQELSEQIGWEAEQHIPFDIKDVQVDYQVLKKREDAGQMDLLLVAAKKDQITEYAQLARDAKLKPIVVDIDAFSMQNLYEGSGGLGDTETVALINVGATLASLNIVSGGVSAFTREIASGGNTITQEIEKQLSITFEEAEKFKCGFAGDVPDSVNPIVEQVLESIAAEIQRSLDFFLATTGDSEISRICLTGGTASIEALAPAIERRARVKVETWSPVSLFTIDSTVPPELLNRRANQLAVALGLTLRKTRETHS